MPVEINYMDAIRDDLCVRPPRTQQWGPEIPEFGYPDFFVGEFGMTRVSEKDIRAIREFMLINLQRDTPHEGDFVVFADGTVRRIAYVIRYCSDDTTGCDEHSHPPIQFQTGGNSFHLGEYGVAVSGSYYNAVRIETLIRTDEMRQGQCWIWHNGWSCRSNGVDCYISFRVWHCSANAPRI